MCGCGIRRRRPAGLQALSKEVVAPCACESRALARSRLSPARQAAASRVTDARTMCGDAAGARWRRRAAASSSRATTATMRRIWPQMPAAWRWKGHPPTTWAATASLRVRSRGSLYIYYMCTHTHTQHTHTTHTHPYMYVCSVKCKECKLEQGVSNICQGCGIQFAQYFCQECKLYSTPTVYIYNIYKPFPPVNLPCTTLVTIQSHYVLSKKKLYYYNIVIFFF
jgi:hypothetical protein